MAETIHDRPGFSGKPWPQYPEEIDGLMAFFVEQGCRSYMEIGCRYGDTFHAVGMALPEGSKLLAVDLPGAKSGMKNKGGHQDSGTYLKRAVADLRGRGYDANVILGDSHDEETLERVKPFAPFDAILIDGDHTQEGVTADWKMYGGLGRFIAFHDIAGTGKWAQQIRPVYQQLCKGRNHREFIFDNKRRGIGVVW